MTTLGSLSKDLVRGILAMGLDPADQGLSKAGLLEFLRKYTMPSNVLDSVFGPNQLIDSHYLILQHQVRSLDNKCRLYTSRFRTSSALF